MNHIMLDLETLGTSPGAVITAIGAVYFEPRSTQLGEKFYANLTDWKDQQSHGLHIDGNTVAWWLKQDREAQQALITGGGTTVEGLLAFNKFLEPAGKDIELWGNGADFDNILLGTMYDKYFDKKPWSYGRNRCYRTMKNLGLGPKTAVRVGTHHNALDDAITQALHLQEIFKCLP